MDRLWLRLRCYRSQSPDAYLQLVQSRHKMVPGRALRKMRYTDSICFGPYRRRSPARSGGQAFVDLPAGRMPASGGLQYSHDFTFSKETICRNGSEGQGMKADKVTVKVAEFRVWCDSCSIRIAPNEERVAVKSKTYHQRCYAKTNRAQETHAGARER